ncbi:tetratricopeptide repeat protein [Rickettsia endosymbiont of Halotydeus destructor]|uniref:tetratricopeptide repeat protein n=1 Tax=Rickettsia endosymbiont of Halotydeus destructor TaxID=2996754 RepID=UPI003BAE2BD2
MFRLLIICIIFLLLYLGFSLVEERDSGVVLTLYDYHIETTFFSLFAFEILALIVSFILIKILILIIDLPTQIQNIFTERKINNNQYSLVRSLSEYIIGNKNKAASIARKILNLKKENKEFHILILAETEEEISKKITHFQELETYKQFNSFAAKKLALLFYNKNFYQEAESYATKVYNLNEYDSEVIAILINCYGKLASWGKFTFVVAKLARFDKIKLIIMNSEIAEYYLLAARNMVENNKTENAIEYLEIALNLNCVTHEILELYFTLNPKININKKTKILKNAFKAHPSLKIVEISTKYTDLLHTKIYEELTGELDVKDHLTLLLATAAYLNLPDKIAELKGKPKLLSFSEA